MALQCPNVHGGHFQLGRDAMIGVMLLDVSYQSMQDTQRLKVQPSRGLAPFDECRKCAESCREMRRRPSLPYSCSLG